MLPQGIVALSPCEKRDGRQQKMTNWRRLLAREMLLSHPCSKATSSLIACELTQRYIIRTRAVSLTGFLMDSVYVSCEKTKKKKERKISRPFHLPFVSRPNDYDSLNMALVQNRQNGTRIAMRRPSHISRLYPLNSIRSRWRVHYIHNQRRRRNQHKSHRCCAASFHFHNHAVIVLLFRYRFWSGTYCPWRACPPSGSPTPGV